MERTDKITVEPMKVDDQELSSTEVTLTGDTGEVAILVAGLKSLRSAIDVSQPVTGYESDRAHEVIDELIEQLETPANVERVELGPEIIDQNYIQRLVREHS